MIKKMESKEYALGVERMDKEVGAPIDIAQSPMLMAAYEAGWDGRRYRWSRRVWVRRSGKRGVRSCFVVQGCI